MSVIPCSNLLPRKDLVSQASLWSQPMPTLAKLFPCKRRIFLTRAAGHGVVDEFLEEGVVFRGPTVHRGGWFKVVSDSVNY